MTVSWLWLWSLSYGFFSCCSSIAGKGEAHQYRKRLERGGTDAGTVRYAMFAQEWEAIRKGGAQRGRLRRLDQSQVVDRLAFAFLQVNTVLCSPSSAHARHLRLS